MGKHELYPMVLNGVFIGMLDLRADQIDYFNIPAPTEAEAALQTYVGSRAGYTRNRFPERLDDTAPVGTPITVGRVAAVGRTHRKIKRGAGGKPIKIPTELTSTPINTSTGGAGTPVPRKPTIRFTTIKFPGAADLSEISRWLDIKLVAHKPNFFISPAGQSYPVGGFSNAVAPTGVDTTP